MQNCRRSSTARNHRCYRQTTNGNITLFYAENSIFFVFFNVQLADIGYSIVSSFITILNVHSYGAGGGGAGRSKLKLFFLFRRPRTGKGIVFVLFVFPLVRPATRKVATPGHYNKDEQRVQINLEKTYCFWSRIHNTYNMIILRLALLYEYIL